MSESIWCPNDKHGLIVSIMTNQGQINPTTLFGREIMTLCLKDDIKNILEIGTWNGLGSTRCILEALKLREDKNYNFYSLEANSEKSAFAKDLYKNENNVHILNEVIYNDEKEDIEQIFPELFSNGELRRWHSIDMENMKSKPLFLNRKDLPEIFDFILLDGGEFTTWYEYQALKDRCHYLALDDTNASKCNRIVADLKNQPNKWKIINEIDERNGAVIAVRINL
jgi:hypothetical protein